MRQILTHVNKIDFSHQLVPGPENKIIVSHFKNIDVLNLRFGGTHQISCDSSLYKGCFPINKGTPTGPLKLNVLQESKESVMSPGN